MMSTLKRRNWDGPSSRRVYGRIATFPLLISFSILSFLIYVLHMNTKLLSKEHHHTSTFDRNDPKDELWTILRALPNEVNFRLTLKSCRPLA